MASSQQVGRGREMSGAVLLSLWPAADAHRQASLSLGQSVGLAWDEGSVKTEASEWEESGGLGS